GGAIILGNLFGNEVSVDRELIVDVFVDSDHFFTHVRGHVIAALELRTIGGRGEDTAILAAGMQQRLCVRIQQSRWNRIAVERYLLSGVRSAGGATAERLARGCKLSLNARGELARKWRVQLRKGWCHG